MDSLASDFVAAMQALEYVANVAIVVIGIETLRHRDRLTKLEIETNQLMRELLARSKREERENVHF